MVELKRNCVLPPSSLVSWSAWQNWCEELQAHSGTVVAISRKAPRLIELLIREGLLPSAFMSRVIRRVRTAFFAAVSGQPIDC